MSAREVWKAYYRLHRIALRETMKAMTDAVVFGQGVCVQTEDGPRHVSRDDVLAPTRGTGELLEMPKFLRRFPD